MTTLSENTFEWVIEHLSKHYDTDIFPKAFEFKAINYLKDKAIDFISSKDICQWQTRPFRKCLVPKQRYGFRIATQLDPLDILFYLCLIYEVGDFIEESRISVQGNISFSSRFSPDDEDHLIFSREIGYPSFQEYSKLLSEDFEYVVITDIADFYPRIYLHRLENALREAIQPLPSHVTAIIKLIKSWNQNVSYGIPIGNNPSRLLAELVIDDVDRTLLSDGFVFCRYVDDYRIFCNSKEDAYRSLSKLARLLFDMHGLTLQSQKTKILTTERFIHEFYETEKRVALDSLSMKFRELLDEIGIRDPYHLIEYGELPQEIKDEIDELNLLGLLEENIEEDDYDLSLARFLLNRLGWLKNPGAVDLLLNNIEKLYPIFSEVIKYFARLSDDIPGDERQRIGNILLGLLKGSVVSQLEYHRTMIMGLFAGSDLWGNSDQLPEYYMLAQDDWMKRSVVLAIGKASQDFWIRSRKTQFETMPPWERRAFLYAASCLPADERYHWYRAIRSRVDILENWIIDWCRSEPINQ